LPARLAAAGLLLLLLALTLGLKLALAGREVAADDARLVRDIVTGFQARGFQTTIVDRRYQSDIVVARRGSCLAAVRDGDDGATLDAEFRQNAAWIGPLRYVYGGAVTARAPRLLPTLTASGQLLLGRLGIAIVRRPVIAVAVRPACAIAADFFSDLRLHLAAAARRAAAAPPRGE
jgi:hypothetical protein